MSGEPTPEEIDKAWDIHKDADQVLQARVNAFLLSQSFLITAFVILFAAPDKGWEIAAIGEITCVVALAITWVLRGSIKLTIDRLWNVKREYLIARDEYQFYIARNHDRRALPLMERRAKFDTKKPLLHDFGDKLPAIVALFWLGALAINSTFFLTAAK